jgi:signal transduction histidine kinase
MTQQTTEDVNTFTLVSEIVSLLFLPKHYEVTISNNLPTIHTRKIKLQQVFQNLISNSIKYNNKTNPTIEIGVSDTGGFYTFFVKDNGQGISKKDHDRIFKLFETTDNKSTKDSATGVGLNLLKVLVEEQGGKIWVESEPGQGSTFYFEWRK